MVKKITSEDIKEDKKTSASAKKTTTAKPKIAKEAASGSETVKKTATAKTKDIKTESKQAKEMETAGIHIVEKQSNKEETVVATKKVKSSQKPISSNFKSRRKTSLAIIKSSKPSKNGKITVNGIDFTKYFKIPYFKDIITAPFKALKENTFDVSYTDFDFITSVNGGGFKGQAEALAQAIARFLSSLNEEYRKILKQSGFLSTDMRNVERKVPGFRKSRKKEQFSKR